jgi:hypothetical protein
MSFLKICQICDTIAPVAPSTVPTNGTVYVEDVWGQVSVDNTPIFPLDVICEVFDWGTSRNFINSGALVSQQFVSVTVPDASTTIRIHCYNILKATYPNILL